MGFPYITGKAKQPPQAPVELPPTQRQKQVDPAGYLIDSRLADAVNVALILGQPLLLTGEPGTGKTQLAFRVAWELGYGKPLVFNTKSTSTARDLFYTFDTMGRFHAAQTGIGSGNNLDYITYAALGLAILQSRSRESVGRYLPAGFEHSGPRRSVVLIDEVDKAPRDFPNDLLQEVETMSFRISELQNAEISADVAYRPVLILTSNSEKNLPDAFLRRCVFFNIPFPQRENLVRIVQSRLEGFADGSGKLLESAIDFFLKLRERNLRKPPSTAELLNFLQTLAQHGAQPDQALIASSDALRASLSTLGKTREDLEDISAFISEQRRI